MIGIDFSSGIAAASSPSARNSSILSDNPFSTSLQTLMPRQIKPLMKFNRWAFYSHDIFGNITRKMAEYPITEVMAAPPRGSSMSPEFSGDNIAAWKDFLDNEVEIRKVMLGMGLDYFVYGNSFVLPIAARLHYYRCQGCSLTFSSDDTRLELRKFDKDKKAFRHKCFKCGDSWLLAEKPKNPVVQYVRPLRLNPENFEIDYNPMNGESTYYFQVPGKVKTKITSGEEGAEYRKFLSPRFLAAALSDGVLRFKRDTLFHFSAPGLAEEDMGWGKPPSMSVMQAIYMMAIVRKSEEQICVSPETLVETVSGLRRADDIREGDLLRTHLGRYMPVVKRFDHGAKDGELAKKITIASLPFHPGEYSPEHPILTLLESGESDFLPAKQIKKGDYLLYPAQLPEGDSGTDPDVDGRVSQLVMNGDRRAKLNFLRAYFRKDGGSMALSGVASFETHDTGAMYDVYRLVIDAGCVPSVTMKSGRFVVSARGESGRRLRALFSGADAAPVKKSGKSGFFWKNYFAVRVDSVEDVQVDRYVNYEVAEDNTYCTAGVATHNCSEHIVPMRILSPAASGGMNPMEWGDMADWQTQLQQWLLLWKTDKNIMPITNFPVNVTNVGGDSRALLSTPQLQEFYKMSIINGMGVPREFHEGGLCMSPDTLVFTSRGMETLEEITPSEPGMTSDAGRSIVSHQGVKPLVAAHHAGSKPVMQAWTRLGLEIVAAPTHPVLVLQPNLAMEFKNMDELHPGDRVAVKVGANLWSTETPKIDFTPPVNSRFYDVEIPKELTPELARLLGYLISEGSCVDERRIGFGNSDLEVIQDFGDCCESVFGYRPNFWRNVSSSERGNFDFFQTEIGRRQAVELLYSLGVGGYAAEKTVPKIIRLAPKPLVVEYLRAYFEGDGGTVDACKKQPVSATSMSQRLMQETQLLLLNMGIVSSRYRPYPEQPCLQLQIRSGYVDVYAKEIGFITTRKKATLAARTPTMVSATASRKIPYVSDLLDEFRTRHLKGDGSWTFQPVACELTKDSYSVDEVAELADRERSTIGIYVRSGALKAKKVPSVGGRFSAHEITKEDLRDFLENHGLGRRRKAPRHQFEISYERLSGADLSFVREKDPVLADRIEAVALAEFAWDEIIDIEALDDQIPMRDLTVGDAHSYQANGVLVHNSFSGSSMSLRMLQNHFDSMRISYDRFLDFFKKFSMRAKGFSDVALSFAPLRLADDVQKTQMMLQLMDKGLISRSDALSHVGFNYEEQRAKIRAELEGDREMSRLEAVAAAESAKETTIIDARAQAEAEYEHMRAQQELRDKEKRRQLMEQQAARRNEMMGMNDQELQQFVMSGGASVSDIIYLANHNKIPKPVVHQLIDMVIQMQRQVLEQFGINPVTMDGLPPDLVTQIGNNIMPPKDIAGIIQNVQAQAAAEAAAAGQAPGGPPQGGGGGGQPPQQGGGGGNPNVKKYMNELSAAKSPQERSVLMSKIKASDPEGFAAMQQAQHQGEQSAQAQPAQLPPRRDSGQSMG